jgi:internalin A
MQMQSINYLDQRLAECREHRSVFLDLGNCGLSRLPDVLAEFTWLEDLNLGTVYWDEAGEQFAESINYGSLNHLIDEDFTALRGLSALRKLSLRNCNLGKADMLQHLTQLHTLNISDNGIRNIDSLTTLQGLVTLSLFDNEVKDAAPLAKLTNLRILSLNYNCISDLSPLAALTNLTELHLSFNQIVDIEPLTHLPQLRRLNLNGNKITAIRPITTLMQLEYLVLDRNPVNDCPPEIAFSGSIARIRAYFDQMDKSSAAQMESFKPSDQAATPPREAKPTPEVKLILVGNATAGKTSLSKVLRHHPFESKENTTHGIQIEEWVLFGNALEGIEVEGQSLERLRVNVWDFGGQEYYHGTHQIFLDSNAVYILVWEAAHNENRVQSTRVFVDGNEAQASVEHFHYSYWLDNVRFHAAGALTGHKPPIFMVQNKVDLAGGRGEWPDPGLLRRYEISHTAAISAKLARSQSRIERRYHYSFEVFREDLLRTLAERAVANTQVQNLPTTWVQVRRYVRRLRIGEASPEENPFAPFLQENAWLAYADFAAACRKLDADLDPVSIETLVYYLHQVGVVIWLPKIDKDKVFIDPAWLTEKIYLVLNNHVRQANGRFSSADISERLGAAEADLLIRLMQEWEIVFPTDAHNWVAPQYLPDEHPVQNLFRIALTGLQEQFTVVRAPLFFYRKMLQRLIFRYGNHPEVQEKEFWKNGILLVGRQGARIFLQGQTPPDEPHTGRLMVCIERNREDTDLWRQRIALDVLAILSDSKMNATSGTISPQAPDWQQNIPALRAEAERRTDIELSNNGIDFVALPDLLAAAKNGLSAVLAGPGRQRLALRDFAPLLTALQLTPPPPTIFISYAQEDKPLRERLEQHLAPLRRQQQVMVWSDAEIVPGQNQDEMVMRNLKSADIILLLVSPALLSSSFIWEKELQPALERHDRGECRVIPVLMRPCAWQDMPFARLQMLPLTAEAGRLQALTSWPNADEAYAAIAQGIQRALVEIKIL